MIHHGIITFVLYVFLLLFAGYNIRILATPCDGKRECLGNEDEEDCGDKLETLLLLIGITFSASLLVSGNVEFINFEISST